MATINPTNEVLGVEALVIPKINRQNVSDFLSNISKGNLKAARGFLSIMSLPDTAACINSSLDNLIQRYARHITQRDMVKNLKELSQSIIQEDPEGPEKDQNLMKLSILLWRTGTIGSMRAALKLRQEIQTPELSSAYDQLLLSDYFFPDELNDALRDEDYQKAFKILKRASLDCYSEFNGDPELIDKYHELMRRISKVIVSLPLQKKLWESQVVKIIARAMLAQSEPALS